MNINHLLHFLAIADLVAESVEATVKPEVCEVVEATVRLTKESRAGVRQADLKACSDCPAHQGIERKDLPRLMRSSAGVSHRGPGEVARRQRAGTMQGTASAVRVVSRWVRYGAG